MLNIVTDKLFMRYHILLMCYLFQAQPALEIADRFITAHVQRALTADASASATPMNWSEVANTTTITNNFGTSSYTKGSSVLRMLEHFVGYATFRNALRYYLKDK